MSLRKKKPSYDLSDIAVCSRNLEATEKEVKKLRVFLDDLLVLEPTLSRFQEIRTSHWGFDYGVWRFEDVRQYLQRELDDKTHASLAATFARAETGKKATA